MDIKSLFTTNEELEELEDHGATTNIVGFVDSIMAPVKAGKNNDDLFKFILSNGRKRITILVWGSVLINKYYQYIRASMVVNINGGHCRAVSSKFNDDSNNLVPFVILIKENTAISFLGYHALESETTKEVQKTTFDNIHTMEGLVELSGYIRTKFSLVHTRSGLTSYGLGAITNAVKKITVQIKQFVESELEIGDFVTVTGTVIDQNSLMINVCNSMSDTQLDPEVDALAPEKVQRGDRAVKRVRTASEKKC